MSNFAGSDSIRETVSGAPHHPEPRSRRPPDSNPEAPDPGSDPPSDANRSTLPLSIAVSTYDGITLLEKNLPSLIEAAARYPGPVDILVVDDGSRDGSADFVRKRFGSKILLVEHGRNRGVPSAFNTGLRSARHPWVLLINNDVNVDPGFLRPLADGVRPPDVFAVQSTILPDPPGARRASQDALRYDLGLLRVEPRACASDPNAPAYEEIPYACACATLYRREAALALGGFDERLYRPGYWEDADLSLRAHHRGWRLLRSRDSRVRHGSGMTMRRILDDFRFRTLFTRNQLLFHWKNLAPGMLIRHLCLLPRQVLGSFRRGNLAFLAGLLQALPRAPRAICGRRNGGRIDWTALAAMGALSSGERGPTK